MLKKSILVTALSFIVLSFGIKENDLVLMYEIHGSREKITFGKSIGFYPDIDGDGVDELVVGAQNGGDASQGEIFIFVSSGQKVKMFSSEAAFSMSGAYSGSNLGNYIESGCDINGDNINDLVISAAGERKNPGDILVFFGRERRGTFSDFVPDMIIHSLDKEEWFGFSVCTNGDFNGDGINDLVIGAPYATVNSVKECGKIYVFYGNKILKNQTTENADIVITGEDKEKLGNSVSFVQDINGDGKDELLAGAFYYFTEDNGYIGRSYIFYGGKKTQILTSSNSEYQINGESDFDFFGGVLSGLGDIDNDNKGDFIISSNSDGKAGSYTGKVYLFSGKSVTSKISAKNADLIYEGTYGYCALGSDFDNNNKSVYITGQGILNNPGAVGSLYRLEVNSFGNNGKNKFELLFKSRLRGSSYGNVVKAYDINRDGKKEIFVGAFLNDVNGEKSGSVYVYRTK